ncbi:hypothetical protein HDU81_008616, partial [Chytriomyces hyalinus]
MPDSTSPLLALLHELQDRVFAMESQLMIMKPMTRQAILAVSQLSLDNSDPNLSVVAPQMQEILSKFSKSAVSLKGGILQNVLEDASRERAHSNTLHSNTAHSHTVDFPDPNHLFLKTRPHAARRMSATRNSAPIAAGLGTLQQMDEKKSSEDEVQSKSAVDQDKIAADSTRSSTGLPTTMKRSKSAGCTGGVRAFSSSTEVAPAVPSLPSTGIPRTPSLVVTEPKDLRDSSSVSIEVPMIFEGEHPSVVTTVQPKSNQLTSEKGECTDDNESLSRRGAGATTPAAISSRRTSLFREASLTLERQATKRMSAFYENAFSAKYNEGGSLASLEISVPRASDEKVDEEK